MGTKMAADLLRQERYRVERRLGHGAMGTVLLARDTVLGRVVAVKVLADHLAADDAFRRRFLREARLAARLCHPSVVQVFDVGDDGDRPFIVMEYVEGETVAARLAAGRRFGPDELVALATQLAAGLAHAHDHGVVHRDVKPHNVLLRPDGVAKLTDFGIARAVEEHGLTEIGTVLGTAPFMAPEQAAGGPVGPAADVYAFGALVRHVAAGPLPARLAGVVDAALASDPTARPSAADIHRHLASLPEMPAEFAPTEVRGADAEQGTTVMPVSGRDAPRWLRRWSAWPVIAVAVLVVLLALFLPRSRSGGKPATTPSIAPVPTAADPSQTARNLADWLRAQAGVIGPKGQPGS
jgi:Protein kinase domain